MIWKMVGCIGPTGLVWIWLLKRCKFNVVLGASKLSVPSIGGTVNILTKGIGAKRSIKFRQEIGNNGFLRQHLGITTGRLENGWGISAAGSYKQGDGWVDANFTERLFLLFKN